MLDPIQEDKGNINMSSQLPSTITVYVDPLDTSTVYRPFSSHPAFTIAGAYISLLLTSTVLSFAGINSLVITSVNMLALTVPAMIAVYCYCKPLTILRANQKWQNEFLSGVRLEIGMDAELINSAEVMIALRSGENTYADISAGGHYKTYDLALNSSEVVLFSMSEIDREWALVNANLER
jgi:hypothetical protein